MTTDILQTTVAISVIMLNIAHSAITHIL